MHTKIWKVTGQSGDAARDGQTTAIHRSVPNFECRKCRKQKGGRMRRVTSAVCPFVVVHTMSNIKNDANRWEQYAYIHI